MGLWIGFGVQLFSGSAFRVVCTVELLNHCKELQTKLGATPTGQYRSTRPSTRLCIRAKLIRFLKAGCRVRHRAPQVGDFVTCTSMSRNVTKIRILIFNTNGHCISGLRVGATPAVVARIPRTRHTPSIPLHHSLAVTSAARPP